MGDGMKLQRYIHHTVTHDDWSVSCTTGHGIVGAILNVHRHRINGRVLNWKQTMNGVGNGTLFPSTEAARQWAFDHGYTKLYFTHADLRIRRKAEAYRYTFTNGHRQLRDEALNWYGAQPDMRSEPISD